MAEVVRRLKINRRYASSACSWCGDLLVIGTEGVVCESCESPHHASCWKDHGGCGLSDCVNAPLVQIDNVQLASEGKKSQLRANEKICRFCKKTIAVELQICRYCGEIVSLDGQYHGSKKIAREAKQALLYSIAGIFCAGLILAPVAFKVAMDAKKHIANSPRLRGRGMAIAAQVIAVVNVVGIVVQLVRNPLSLLWWVDWLVKRF